MVLPLAEWKGDHIFIPSGLVEILYGGFVIHLKIRRNNGDTMIETIIRKEKPAEKVKPTEIAPMAVHPQQSMPEALELLNDGFTLDVSVLLDKTIIIAEKKL